MPNPKINFAWVVIFAALLFCTGCDGFKLSPRPTTEPTSVVPRRTVGYVPGSIAPDFVLRSARGTKISLSQYRGQPVILNFFATWCGPCRNEMPGMQKVYQRYWKRGLAIVAIDVDEDQGKVVDFGNELHLTFPLMLDPNGSVSRTYRVNSVPRTFFVDSEGVIRSAIHGSMEESDFDKEVALLFRLAPTPTAKISQPRAGQPDPTPTLRPPAPQVQPGRQVVEGCINIGSALARSGPGKSFPGRKEMKLNQCASFDAQNQDGTWLRLADEVTPTGERLWLAASYITPKGEIAALPVGE